jgi:hypothetical protein
MDIVIIDQICTYMVQRTSTTIAHEVMMVTKEKHYHMLNEHHVMISLPLLLKCMSVFILVLIHF